MEASKASPESAVQTATDKVSKPPVEQVREGWAEAARRMHENGDGQLLDGESIHVMTEWDHSEWIWWVYAVLIGGDREETRQPFRYVLAG